MIKFSLIIYVLQYVACETKQEEKLQENINNTTLLNEQACKLLLKSLCLKHYCLTLNLYAMINEIFQVLFTNCDKILDIYFKLIVLLSPE